ncbi:MAG: hypothetical protein KGH61_03985 [Candidatus Micrarchaeota archaeon]|nr:hypothetical protein [Candidatus Micrarchaeota archaeon]MDE1848080.1 hypothetical protein [Candidatus Micrarchaeota archaeon]MDE1864943.1 hypothetical protein [Candidatus Micrarchaeota archaeon]
MIALVASMLDPASRNISEFLIKEFEFEAACYRGVECFRRDLVILLTIGTELVGAEFVDALG